MNNDYFLDQTIDRLAIILAALRSAAQAECIYLQFFDVMYKIFCLL